MAEYPTKHVLKLIDEVCKKESLDAGKPGDLKTLVTRINAEIPIHQRIGNDYVYKKIYSERDREVLGLNPNYLDVIAHHLGCGSYSEFAERFSNHSAVVQDNKGSIGGEHSTENNTSHDGAESSYNITTTHSNNTNSNNTNSNNTNHYYNSSWFLLLVILLIVVVGGGAYFLITGFGLFSNKSVNQLLTGQVWVDSVQEGAGLEVSWGTKSTQTNDLGRFEFILPPGTDSLPPERVKVSGQNIQPYEGTLSISSLSEPLSLFVESLPPEPSPPISYKRVCYFNEGETPDQQLTEMLSLLRLPACPIIVSISHDGGIHPWPGYAKNFFFSGGTLSVRVNQQPVGEPITIDRFGSSKPMTKPQVQTELRKRIKEAAFERLKSLGNHEMYCS